MPRSIVVPLDGSSFAEHALPHALAHASTDARLHLVLVHRSVELWDAARPADAAKTWETSLRRNEEDYLAEIARSLTGAGVRVDVELRDGDVVASIAGHAAEVGADLVVITSHARGGVERAWLGSVADGLIRSAAMPILVVRPTAETRDVTTPAPPPNLILVAWDGSDEARAALDHAVRIAVSVGARLLLTRIVTPYFGPTSPYLPHAVQFDRDVLDARTDAAQRDLAGVVDSIAARHPDGPVVRALVEVHAGPARGILDLADAHGADLIAMGTHGRGAAGRVLLGSVSDKVVRASAVPVLLCRKGT